MHIAIVASDSDISVFLRSTGFSVTQLSPNVVPSLTALLLDHPEITALVIQDGPTSWWSASHILAAAKQLEKVGPTILLGDGILAERCRNRSLVQAVKKKEELPDLLRQQPKATTDGGSRHRPTPPVPKMDIRTIRPLKIPSGRILMLGVIGSQRRIGCTTQAISLWHYCKAIGFDPAVVTSAEQIAEIASVMANQEIDGGHIIEGIPFVADTAHAYDCYILDIGTGSVQEALKATDHLILVAGSKPWELQHTAAALRSAQGRKMGILLSFTSQADAASLRPLFGSQEVAIAPWATDIWQLSVEALLVYDTLLRSTLELLLAETERSAENAGIEFSTSKEDYYV